MMRITNVQGIKNEYYGNFEVLYFLFMNWCMLIACVHRELRGSLENLVAPTRAYITYDVIQNGAENADSRRKNLQKKGTLETTGHPRLRTASSLVERNKQIILCLSVNDCSVSPFFQMLISRWTDW